MSAKEKCSLVQKLITSTKQKYIKLKNVKPGKSNKPEAPLNQDQIIIFPEDLKLRTYDVEDWASTIFDTQFKVSQLLNELPEEVKAIWTKAFNWSVISEEEVNTVIYHPGLTIYPILKYIHMHLASPLKRKESRKFIDLRKRYSDRQVLKILNDEERADFIAWLRIWNNKLTEFEILSGLLKIFINNPLKKLITSPIYLNQHGKFNTIFGEVYW